MTTFLALAHDDLKDVEDTKRGMLVIPVPDNVTEAVLVLFVGCPRDDLNKVGTDLAGFEEYARQNKWQIYDNLQGNKLTKTSIIGRIKDFFEAGDPMLLVLVMVGHGATNGAFICADDLDDKEDAFITVDEIHSQRLQARSDIPFFLYADYCNSGVNVSKACVNQANTYYQASLRIKPDQVEHDVLDEVEHDVLDGVFTPFFLEVQNWVHNAKEPRHLEPALSNYVKRNGRIPACSMPSSGGQLTNQIRIQTLAELMPECSTQEAAVSVGGRVRCPWRCKKGTHKRACGKHLDTKVKCSVCLEFRYDVYALPCGQCVCYGDYHRCGFVLPDSSESSS